MRETPDSLNRASWLPWALLPPTSLWLGMTFLRESAQFWRNAGGYPVELRSFVLELYYPATGGLLLACLIGAAHALSSGTLLRRGTVAGWLTVAMLLGFGLAFAGANNLANVMDGHPLHYHPPGR